MPDRRDIARIFNQRLKALFDRSRLSQAAFADTLDIDRSALSLLLSSVSGRLPRVETLLTIANRHGVTLDWLLGISEDEGVSGTMLPSQAIEAGNDDGASLLMQWHAESSGSKVRYVPARIPDLLRTPETIAYEATASHQSAKAQAHDAAFRLDYNRTPGTDMESCMPRQTLEQFAAGVGIWSDLPTEQRQAQLDHMARLLDELYPSFRLFLFDGRARFSIPYTIFGSTRVAIFAGQMYLVLNSSESIRAMQVHFEKLIRHSCIHPHESADFVRKLRVG